MDTDEHGFFAGKETAAEFNRRGAKGAEEGGFERKTCACGKTLSKNPLEKQLTARGRRLSKVRDAFELDALSQNQTR
jgi:hypothetical protein